MSTWAKPVWGRYKKHQIKNWITQISKPHQYNLFLRKISNYLLIFFPIKILDLICLFNAFETFFWSHNLILYIRYGYQALSTTKISSLKPSKLIENNPSNFLPEAPFGIFKFNFNLWILRVTVSCFILFGEMLEACCVNGLGQKEV